MVLNPTTLAVLIIVGGIAGWLADRVVGGIRTGLIGTILVGIVGAFVGTWVFHQLGIVLSFGPLLSDIITAFVGAVIVLLLARLVFK